jgi:type II secretory pathway component GspD/PulD (secretin)
MASKKGIAITAIILAAITGASFLLWIVPQDVETTFVVSDYGNYLDEVKNIHEVLEESIEIEYENLRAGKISPQDYISVTEVTSSQVTTQISEFVTSKPSEEWQTSYISYMEALKSFNSYIIETKVLAKMIENENTEDEMNETLEKIDMLKSESIEFVKMSDQSRPG